MESLTAVNSPPRVCVDFIEELIISDLKASAKRISNSRVSPAEALEDLFDEWNTRDFSETLLRRSGVVLKSAEEAVVSMAREQQKTVTHPKPSHGVNSIDSDLLTRLIDCQTKLAVQEALRKARFASVCRPHHVTHALEDAMRGAETRVQKAKERLIGVMKSSEFQNGPDTARLARRFQATIERNLASAIPLKPRKQLEEARLLREKFRASEKSRAEEDFVMELGFSVLRKLQPQDHQAYLSRVAPAVAV